MDGNRKIFVSIACLSDPDLLKTLESMFLNAVIPENVIAGVCLQADPADRTFDALVGLRNVRLTRIHYAEAKGPIYARYLTEQLIEDEEYYFQIDCHTRFFPDWDQILMEELEKCKKISPKSVISHYPIKMSGMHSEVDLGLIGVVNRFSYVGSDNIRTHGTLVKLPKEPLLSIGISAAMLFMDTDTKLTVPYDPELNFGLHAAEQLLYAVRLWTHGYDLYAPTRHAIATEYESSRSRVPEYIRRECNQLRGSWPEVTWSKVKYLLELDSLDQVVSPYKDSVSRPDFKFKMGQERTVLEYNLFSGLHEKLVEVFYTYKHRVVASF